MPGIEFSPPEIKTETEVELQDVTEGKREDVVLIIASDGTRAEISRSSLNKYLGKGGKVAR